MKTAIYPFSGDPITFGHIDIILRSSHIFDRVIAAIGINPLKEYLFTLEERLEMARAALHDLPNVEVASYPGLLADFAREHNTNVIIRGIRNAEDFDYEWAINQINQSIDSSLETFWMPCRREKSNISSSAVKELWQRKKDLARMVPDAAIKMLANKHAYIP